MVNSIEKRIFYFVQAFAGSYVFSTKKIQLSIETDLDSDLQLDDAEAEELMENFFKKFSVKKENFNINSYYPPQSFSLNPFKKATPIPVPDLTIGMLIESAKAGRWLYD